MKILNLTQHIATAEQQAAWVIEPSDKKQVQALLTFEQLPSKDGINDRASALANIAAQAEVSAVMIGGAGYLLGALENELKSKSIKVLHAFTVREVTETIKDDGTVEKKAIFKHGGFVEV